ncbi:MAG: VIT1/CCC1 transporter family protein [Pseudomonadota bacterium]
MTDMDGHSLAEVRARLASPKRRGHLRDAVYGGMDGTVTTFALVAGVAGAGLADSVIVALGVANVLADGFSMAAANFSGAKSEQDDQRRIRAIEERQIAENPAGERLELQEILRAKGLEGVVLESATAAIMRNHDKWIEIMLVDEYGLSPTDPRPAHAAAATFIAFVAAGSVPLVPFLLGLEDAFLKSLVSALCVFFLIGSLKSRWALAPWWQGGIETLTIGGVAAFIAYLVGSLFQVTP